MPRGRSKQAYGNRTDLNGKIPKAAPTGMPYGENQKLMDSQSVVPMGSPEMETVAPQAAEESIPMAQKVTPVPLTAPTERPNENILTGATATRQPDRDMQKLKSLQPIFEAEAATDDAPQVFREFVSWLKTQ
jgi:septal ring-binding cell division protein DamX